MYISYYRYKNTHKTTGIHCKHGYIRVFRITKLVEIIHSTIHNTQYTGTVHVCTLHVNPMFSWYLTRYTGRYYTYRNNLKQSIINGLNITEEQNE